MCETRQLHRRVGHRPSQQVKRANRRAGTNRRRLLFEALELRQLLAVTAGPELACQPVDAPAQGDMSTWMADAVGLKANWVSQVRSDQPRSANAETAPPAFPDAGEGESAKQVLVTSNSNGQFTLQRASDGAWLLYPDPESSYLSVRIDGKVFTNAPFGGLDAESHSGNTWVYEPIRGLRISQILTVEGDALKCEVRVKNGTGVAHSIEVRYLFDTQVDDNDGAPLYDGSRHHVSESDFRPPSFTEWRSWRRPDDQSVVGVGTLDPDVTSRVIFAHWPSAAYDPWDYFADPSRPFYTAGYTLSPASDSCVLVYMDMGTLGPGKTGTVATWYGVGDPAPGDLRSRLIAAMEDFVGAVSRYQAAAIEVVAEADAGIAKHIAEDSRITSQAFEFGLDLAAGDGAYIVGKLAKHSTREARDWILKNMFQRFQLHNIVRQPGLIWIADHIKDWIALGEVDFNQSDDQIAQDIKDYLLHPTRLGGVLAETRSLTGKFSSLLPPVLADEALAETMIRELRVLADNVERLAPRRTHPGSSRVLGDPRRFA